MRKRPALAGLTLWLALQMSPGHAAIRFVEISGSTSPAENACPAWVLEDNDDDCSYASSKPLGLGLSQWTGPVFSAGYYEPGNAPAIFTNSVPTPPVLAPAPELPLSEPKSGIPIIAGFVVIDDRDTVAASDDFIGGTIEFGAFQRNVAVSATSRNIESITRIIHQLRPTRVSQATPNASGGFDYVVGKVSNTAVFPATLSGETSNDGGFADVFPSEVASQSTVDVSDFPYWLGPGDNGIARLDGDTAIIGTETAATVWGYSCDDGDGLDGCRSTGINWDGDQRAAFRNVLLELSTDANGNIIAAEAFLINESDVSQSVDGPDSWTGSRLAFSGFVAEGPKAFDDRAVLTTDLLSITVSVLSNDRGKAPIVLEVVADGDPDFKPYQGTATVPAAATSVIEYTRADDQESEQVIVYRITDPDGTSAIGELHVLVTDPIACEDDEIETDRNVPVSVDVTANDAGFDLPPVTVIIEDKPIDGTAVVNADRSITFTPPTDTGGLFVVGYQLNDGSGKPDSCTLTVRIPALPAAVDDIVGLAVDTPETIDVLANDVEITDTPLVIEIVNEPASGSTQIDNTVEGLPRVVYTPDGLYEGTDAFTYRIVDADGDVSNVATVSVTVFGEPENDIPQCVGDTAEAQRGQSIDIDVLANDTGLNAPPITLEVIDVIPEAGGTAEVNPDNTIAFTAPADSGGKAFVRYRAREALNNPVECTAVVSVDDLPVAKDDNYDALNFGKLVILRILNNDEGLTDTPLKLTITAQPLHGTVTVCDSEDDGCPQYSPFGAPYVTYTYDDAAGYPAVDTFRYAIEDNDGDLSGNATVTITPRNTPEANDDPDNFVSLPEDYRTASGYPVTLDVLANDAGLLTGPVTVKLVGSQPGGSAVVNADNTITYTANENFTGFSQFDYEVTDGDGRSDKASVLVFVFPAPVTDTGGSAMDMTLLLILGGLASLRRRKKT